MGDGIQLAREVVRMAAAGGPMSCIVDLLDGLPVGAIDRDVINQADADGQTTLHWCAWYGWAALVPRLLSQGCALSLGNKQGLTPLHLACARAHADTASLLLLSGAAIHASDCLGRTPFDYAISSKLGDVCLSLIQHGAHSHYQVTCEQQLKWLLDEMKPQLQVHIQQHQLAALVLMLRLAPDCSLPSELLTDKQLLDTLLVELPEEWRPAAELASANLLHHAASLGKRQMALSLIEAGASATVSDGSGRTAAQLAVGSELQALLVAAAEMELQSRQFEALKLAAKEQGASVVSYKEVQFKSLDEAPPALQIFAGPADTDLQTSWNPRWPFE